MGSKPPRTYDARGELAPVRHGAPQEVPRAWQGAQKTVDMSENVTSVRTRVSIHTGSPIKTCNLEPRSHLRRRPPNEQLTNGKAGAHRRPRQRVAVGHAAVHAPDFPAALQAQQPVAGADNYWKNYVRRYRPLSLPSGYDCGRRTTTSHTGTVGRHYPPCF